MLTFKDYQKQAATTAMYPADMGLAYTALGLNGEAGEVAEQVKKAIRDDDGEITGERREAIIKELGDVLWYAAMLATEVEVSLDDVANFNLDKLKSRKARGKIQGSGDDR